MGAEAMPRQLRWPWSGGFVDIAARTPEADNDYESEVHAAACWLEAEGQGDALYLTHYSTGTTLWRTAAGSTPIRCKVDWLQRTQETAAKRLAEAHAKVEAPDPEMRAAIADFLAVESTLVRLRAEIEACDRHDRRRLAAEEHALVGLLVSRPLGVDDHPAARSADRPRHRPRLRPWLCTTRRRLALRAALRIERQREVWLGGERVGVLQLAGGAHRVEASTGGGPGWIFGAPALALDAFAVWLARAGRQAPASMPRPPSPNSPGKPPKGPPAKRRRPPRPPSRTTLARAA